METTERRLLGLAKFAQSCLREYMDCHDTANCFWHRRSHFRGLCGIASVFLAGLVEAATGERAEVVYGEFGDDRQTRDHFWVRVPSTGAVLDITLDQFRELGVGRVPSILAAADHRALRFYRPRRTVERKASQFCFFDSERHPFGVVSKTRKNHQKSLVEKALARPNCRRVLGSRGVFALASSVL